MSSTLLAVISLLCGFSVLADRPISWKTLNCPRGLASQSCSYRNPYTVDLAVTLFFQTEDTSGDGSSFQCVSGANGASAEPYPGSNTHTKPKPNPNPNPRANECPSGMVYSQRGSEGWQYCVIADITFPSGVGEYCDYLSDGYEGFDYPHATNPNYQCPPSMDPGSNSAGDDFCVYNFPSSYSLPAGAQPYCTADAFAAHELGFLWGGKTTPAPIPAPPDTNSTVYCARQWLYAQQGSAGDCWFILPAGESFSCAGKSTTNVIGAHGVSLAGSYFGRNTDNGNAGSVGVENFLACFGSGGNGDCKYVNENANLDEYIALSFWSMSEKANELSCMYADVSNHAINVCNYTAVGAGGSGSSCNFLLPAGKTMSCAITNDIRVESAISRVMTTSFLKNSVPVNNMRVQCPNVTYPATTMCDCGYTNNDLSNDMLVMFNGMNGDNQFNSYHCYMWGVNVAAWGANNNNLMDSGSSYFVLPAGSAYNCSMEWGATAFTASTYMKLSGTMFPKYSETTADEETILNLYQKRDGTRKDGEKDGKEKVAPGISLPNSRPMKELQELFYAWKKIHEKEYPSAEEEQLRFGNFQQFISLMDNLWFSNANLGLDERQRISNANDNVRRINVNADLTLAEYNAKMRSCSLTISDIERYENGFYGNQWRPQNYTIPTTVDWRTKGAVTPVKNQGQCGSCWAFSTTGVMESAWFIAGHSLQSLSEETLVACETDCYGCDGGWPYKALDWTAKNGIDTEASYPYTSGGGSVGACEISQHTRANVRVTGHQFVAPNEDAMAAYVANYGPISISLDAMTQLWWPYTGGIMDGCCNKTPDHAVLIIGYGVDSGTDYWIIKNSWGVDWGIDGYLHLAKGTNQCGITDQPVVPILG